MLGHEGKRAELTPEPKPEQLSSSRDAPGRPDRPLDDTQIEEFLKDQYGSKKIDGIDQPRPA